MFVGDDFQAIPLAFSPYLDILQHDVKFVVERLGKTPSGRHMGKQKTDLLQGTLDLLILDTLSSGPLHGWAISKRIQESSRDVLRVNQGSLYPALYRIEDRGWINAEWGVSPEGRRAKFYRLTTAGKKQLVRETAQWNAFSLAVNHVLQRG